MSGCRTVGRCQTSRSRVSNKVAESNLAKKSVLFSEKGDMNMREIIIVTYMMKCIEVFWVLG